MSALLEEKLKSTLMLFVIATDGRDKKYKPLQEVRKRAMELLPELKEDSPGSSIETNP